MLEKILAVSESEAKKARLKYAVTSLLNVSAREALEKFGIKILSQRAEKFKEASKKVQKIQTKNECYMILEQKAYLSRTGVDEKQFIDRESDSSTDSDCDESDILESSNEIGDDEEVINQEKFK